jgi:hypothetical protein
VLVWCKACHHQVPADLEAIIDAGQGDRPLKDLKFRCAKCGSRLTDAVALAAGIGWVLVCFILVRVSVRL